MSDVQEIAEPLDEGATEEVVTQEQVYFSFVNTCLS